MLGSRLQNCKTVNFLKPLCFFLIGGKAWDYIFWRDKWPYQLMGIYFVFIALVLLFPIKNHKNLKILFASVSVLLGTTGLYELFSGQSLFLQILERAIQITTPLVLVQALSTGSFNKPFKTLVKVAVALTFGAHGIYAMGLFTPVPGNFLFMTVSILGVTPLFALKFLFCAGFLDLVIVVTIFTHPQFVKPILFYAAFWGACTALARPLSQIGLQSHLHTLHRWLFEMFIRIPNSGIPLFLLITENIQSKIKDKTAHHSKESSCANV